MKSFNVESFLTVINRKKKPSHSYQHEWKYMNLPAKSQCKVEVWVIEKRAFILLSDISGTSVTDPRAIRQLLPEIWVKYINRLKIKKENLLWLQEREDGSGMDMILPTWIANTIHPNGIEYRYISEIKSISTEKYV